MTVKNIIFDLDNTLYSPTSAMDAGISRRMMAAVVDFLGTDLEAATELRKRKVPYFSTTLEWLRSEGLKDVEGYLPKSIPTTKRTSLCPTQTCGLFCNRLGKTKSF